MLRLIGVLVLAAAITLGACGRQVTGLTAPGTQATGGLQPGFMLVRFRTQGDMNFGQFKYVIVFNTTGNRQQPYANGFQTGFQNYSYAFVVSGNNATISTPQLIQYFQNVTVLGQVQTFDRTGYINQGQLIFIPPPTSNGTAREFTIIFNRVLFTFPNPAGGATATPSPSPTASPAPLASGQTPAPSPTPAPGASGLATQWNVNFFTTDLQNNPIDALGVNGVNGLDYQLTFDVSAPFDIRDQLTKPAGSIGVFSASAAIAGGELQNNP